MNQDSRHSPRVPITIPLRVRWHDHQGRAIEEKTETEVLNGAGARIHLSNPVALGLEVDIVNLDNQESAKARVAWATEYLPGSGQRVGIEFLTPRAAFWGSKYSP